MPEGRYSWGGESGWQTTYLTELIGRVRMGGECGWERPFRGAKRTGPRRDERLLRDRCCAVLLLPALGS